jgi:maltose alpha-D-glucosyltransferase/alpha-amylase
MERIAKLIKQIYPKNPAIQEKLQLIIDRYRGGKKSLTDSKTSNSANSWHKNFNLYVVYPDSFTDSPNEKGDLRTLSNKLPYIKELGMDAVHILPFLDSPMIDAGFDISNYKKVRDDLGGNTALEHLIETANKAGIRIFMDLVLNHVSNQHNWFKKALEGNKKYRDFFLYSESKPNLIDIYKDEEAVWAEYKYEDRIIRDSIVFPEQVGDIPHWTQADDGYWYFHKFYPHQIDVNWNNPEVFLAFADIIAFWASKGLNFRLDVIGLVAKDIYSGINSNHPNLFKILEILNLMLQEVSPDSAILVETCHKMDTMKKYFGSSRPRVHLAYDFYLMNSLWHALIDHDVKPLWEILDENYSKLPEWAGWVNFLRNHDELILKDPELRDSLYKGLIINGLSFREGFGVSGRTASFLNNNTKRIAASYMLLASMPGSPALIYGDEIGKKNDIQYMRKQTKYKQELTSDPNIENDTRDINRGIIIAEELNCKVGQEIYQMISTVFKARRKMKPFFTAKPKRILSKHSRNKGIFSCKYETDNSELIIIINLTSASKSVTFGSDLNTILNINNVKYVNKQVKLPPYGGIWFESP